MRVAIGTNVLAYAEGVNDPVRQREAKAVLKALPIADIVLPVQVLGELFRVLTRKAKRPAPEARAALLAWQDSFATHDTTASALASAMDMATDHGVAFWDAVILAVSAEAGCRLLLSEDMHESFTWRGVTVVNPFAANRHTLLLNCRNCPGSPSPTAHGEAVGPAFMRAFPGAAARINAGPT